MIADREPASISIQRFLVEEPLFSRSYRNEYVKDLEIRSGDEGAALTYMGWRLGPEHLAVWKVLVVQQRLRWARGEAVDAIQIKEDEFFELLGVDKVDDRMRERVRNVLTELQACCVHRAGGGFATRLIQEVTRYRGVYEVRTGLADFDRLTGVDSVELAVSWEAREAADQPFQPDFSDEAWSELRRALHPNEPTPKPKPTGPGFVYILTNPSMPGLIKIGKTRLDRVEDRAAQLHSTGVPDAFEVAYACRTDDPDAVERVMHEAFGPRRVNGRREFFEVEPERAAQLLSLHDQERS